MFHTATTTTIPLELPDGTHEQVLSALDDHRLSEIHAEITGNRLHIFGEGTFAYGFKHPNEELDVAYAEAADALTPIVEVLQEGGEPYEDAELVFVSQMMDESISFTNRWWVTAEGVELWSLGNEQRDSRAFVKREFPA